MDFIKILSIKKKKIIYEIKVRVYQDKQNENQKQDLLHDQVQELVATRILHQCFHNQAIGLGKVICMNVDGLSWSLGLQRFHIRVHLGLQLLVEVIEHDAEFRSELRVLTWKHERLGEHRGRCPEDGGCKSGSLVGLRFQMVLRIFRKAFWKVGWCGKTLL